MKHPALIAALAITILVSGCGGSGSSSTASVPVTPETQAPVAQLPATGTTQTAGSPNVVTTKADIPTGTVGFALAQTRVVSAGSTTTAANSFTGTLLAYLDIAINSLIKSAHAQQTTGCVTDALKLVGIDASGTVTDIQTTEAPATCDVGFREIFDAGNYVLLTGEGLYKDGLTCNLLFLHKESGKLFCVGENYTSRYTIKDTSSSSNTSTGSMTTPTSPAAEKIQIVKNQSDPSKTDYILVSTRETAFDSNGQINGVRIKLLRFNLKDLENGPTIKLLAEGLEQNWMQQASSNENLSFNLENFKIARNGDVFAIYSYYLWTRNPWSSTQKRNVNFFVYDEADNATVKKVNGQSIQNIIDQMNSLQIASNGTPTTGTSGSYNWYSIPCMFDDPESTDSVIFTTPFWTWNNVQNGVNSYNYSSSSASLVIKASGRSAGSSVGLSAVKVSQLCADTNAWSGNAPVKVVNPATGRDVWFTTQTAYVNGYYNNNYFWGQMVSLVGNDLSTPRDANGNPTYQKDDLTVSLTAPVTNGSTTTGAMSYSDWQNSRSVYSSKDYLYILKKTANFSYNDSVGNTIFRFKPFDQIGVFTYANQTLDLDATTPTMGSRALNETAKVWVTSVATSALDNIVNLVGRDLNSDNFERVFGKIDESGNYTGTNITSSKYSSFTIVRM